MRITYINIIYMYTYMSYKYLSINHRNIKKYRKSCLRINLYYQKSSW